MTDRDVFTAALEQADPVARSAFLDRACAGDAALRQRVEALLHAHEVGHSSRDIPAIEQAEFDQLGDPTCDAEVFLPGEQTYVAGLPLPTNLAADAELFLNSGGEWVDQPADGGPPPARRRLDHYEVLEIIGRGGMGVVLKARDTSLQRVVAVKLLAPHLAASDIARKRFIREAQAAAAVRDDNVVSIYAVQEAAAVPYLVMEYIDGLTLAERINQSGPLEVKEVLRIGMQTASGLAAAHKRGLVHRDIKPANILLEGESAASVGRVKITDFGLARAGDDASVTHTGLIAGTPAYMAPEQARGGLIDHRADLFSLGSVLYVLCTGRLPFPAANTMAALKHVCEDAPRPLREINPAIPDFLEDVVSRLHAKNPDDRFQSAAEVAGLLSRHLAYLEKQADAPPERKKKRLLPAPLLVVGAVLLLAAAFAVWSILWPGKAPVAGPCPLDGRKREDVPPERLALAGGGDPAQAPAELVAVLGDARFLLRYGVQGVAWSRDGKQLAACASNWDERQHRHSGWEVKIWDAADGRLVRALRLDCPVSSVAFSPNGKRLAAAHQDPGHTVKVWELSSGEELLTLKGHAAPVRSVAFSPDGKFLASAGEDARVVLWNATDGERRFTLARHTRAVLHVAFSPDGQRLVSCADDGDAILWNCASGRFLVAHRCPNPSVRGAAFSPDGKRVVSVSYHSTPQVWDAGTGHTLFELKGHTSEVVSVDWSRDGKHIATGSMNKLVKIWDARNGREVHTCLGHQRVVTCVAFRPDGSQVVSGSLDGTLRFWDAATGEAQPAVRAVAFSPDGRSLASAGSDRMVKVWDLETGQVVHSLPGHTEVVFALAYSPNGKLLASGSGDGTIALWNVAGDAEVRTLKGHSHSVSLLQFSPDGRTLAAGGEGGVKQWDVASAREVAALEHPGRVRCVAFSPDGHLLASGGEDHTVHVHDLLKGRSQTFKAPNSVNNVAFSPDGLTVAAACDAPDAVVRLWQMETGKETTLRGPGAPLHALAFSPTAPLLAVGAQDGDLRLWDWNGAAPRSLPFGPGSFRGGVRAVAFTTDGRYLATANGNGTITIFHVPTAPPPYEPGLVRKLPDPKKLARRPSPADRLDRAGIAEKRLKKAGGGDKTRAPAELVAILGPGHEGEVAAVAVSPDGQTLASTGSDRTVRLWDLATGRLRCTLRGHQGPGTTVVFRADGQVLASSSEDSTIKLWDVAAGGLGRTLGGDGRRVNHVAFTHDGQGLVSAGEGTVQIWDVQTGQLRQTFRGEPLPIWDVAVSPDGKTLASSENRGGIQLRETATGWDLGRLQGQRAQARCVAFHPDGHSLAAAYHGSSPALRIWDLATLQEEHQLEGHPSGALACVWRADGRLLATCGSNNGAVRLWDLSGKLPRNKLLAVLPSSTRPVNGVAFTPEGRHLVTANPDGTIYVLRLAGPGEVFQAPARPQ